MDEDRVRTYEDRYLADAGFESHMIRARRRCVLDLARYLAPGFVLEIGCGTDSLYEHTAGLVPTLRRWVIVEPGERFAMLADRQVRRDGTDLRIVRGLFEECAEEVFAALGRSPDTVFCLGVLQGIPDPRGWLALLRSTMEPGGTLVLTVANARSLHRRLARAMGLIAHEQALSDRDNAAFHHIVFDAEGLRSAVEAAGWEIRNEGGFLLKPFAHAQMERIEGVLSEEILDGLWTLGRELPELASEIYVVAVAV